MKAFAEDYKVRTTRRIPVCFIFLAQRLTFLKTIAQDSDVHIHKMKDLPSNQQNPVRVTKGQSHSGIKKTSSSQKKKNLPGHINTDAMPSTIPLNDRNDQLNENLSPTPISSLHDVSAKNITTTASMKRKRSDDDDDQPQKPSKLFKCDFTKVKRLFSLYLKATRAEAKVTLLHFVIRDLQKLVGYFGVDDSMDFEDKKRIVTDFIREISQSEESHFTKEDSYEETIRVYTRRDFAKIKQKYAVCLRIQNIQAKVILLKAVISDLEKLFGDIGVRKDMNWLEQQGIVTNVVWSLLRSETKYFYTDAFSDTTREWEDFYLGMPRRLFQEIKLRYNALRDCKSTEERKLLVLSLASDLNLAFGQIDVQDHMGLAEVERIVTKYIWALLRCEEQDFPDDASTEGNEFPPQQETSLSGSQSLPQSFTELGDTAAAPAVVTSLAQEGQGFRPSLPGAVKRHLSDEEVRDLLQSGKWTLYEPLPTGVTASINQCLAVAASLGLPISRDFQVANPHDEEGTSDEEDSEGELPELPESDPLGSSLGEEKMEMGASVARLLWASSPERDQILAGGVAPSSSEPENSEEGVERLVLDTSRGPAAASDEGEKEVARGGRQWVETSTLNSVFTNEVVHLIRDTYGSAVPADLELGEFLKSLVPVEPVPKQPPVASVATLWFDGDDTLIEDV